MTNTLKAPKAGARDERYKETLDMVVAKGCVTVECMDPLHFKEGLSRYKEWMRQKGTLFFGGEWKSGPDGKYFQLEITWIERQMGRGRTKK